MVEPAHASSPFGVISPVAVERTRTIEPKLLILDVRRRQAFLERLEAIPGAIAFLLDDDPVQLPDAPRDTPVILYCLCRGEASSSRAARLLVRAGYRDVSVLRGGLGAWQDEGRPVAPISVDVSRRRLAWDPCSVEFETPSSQVSQSRLDDPFLSRLEDNSFVHGRSLPLRRSMCVAFVDMVDSTELFARLPVEEVLRLVQAFMEVVVEVGALHCGDVHDFQGDGALLYFEGVGEAVPAAFEMRRRLLARRDEIPDLSLPRISLDEGTVVIGLVGGRFRRAVGLIGACVPRAARILKLGPPGGIITTENVIRLARESNPDLAQRFVSLGSSPPLKGMEADRGELYLAEPPSSVNDHAPSGAQAQPSRRSSGKSGR
jgi:class 3 adenylate cyclase/rhodanese-related sulfurtransferase